ncbi:MAG: flagellar biosynthetic protein FliO [Oligoflexia bacterium]|nr:flagellar biosynthetic protein FliO [Oligoflexia bacterium]
MSRLFFSFLVLVAGFILSTQEAQAGNSLSDISTKRIGQDFFVELTFAEDVVEAGVTLEYSNRTIEVNIPSAITKVKKGITKISDSMVDHLYTTQATADALKCQIILTPPNQATQFKNSTAVLSRANKLFIKVTAPATTSPTATAANTIPTELPGALIDQMMRKEAGEMGDTVTLTPIALPEKKILTATTEEVQPVFKTEQALNKEKAQPKKALLPRMLMSLAIVLAVIGGGYYAFKKWPGSKKLSTRNRMIEVMAQHHLGAKRSLAVVKVAGEAVLIGVTDNNITILKTLALLDDDMAIATGGKSPAKFNSALANKVQGEVDRKATLDAITNSDKDEEFSMRGLREIVGERLKSMREL